MNDRRKISKVEKAKRTPARSTKNKKPWADAIEAVLRKAGGPLHVKEIAKRVARKHGWPENSQTVSAKCQRDWRFVKIKKPLATYDLAEFWKDPDGTIQSMITVKAGTLLSGKLRAKALRHFKHCQKCCRKSDLRLHHKREKAELFREIKKNHNLSFGPADPIRNIMRGFTLLVNHPEFCHMRHLTLLCKKHHDAEHEVKK